MTVRYVDSESKRVVGKDIVQNSDVEREGRVQLKLQNGRWGPGVGGADSAGIGWRSTGSLAAVGSAAAGAVDEADSKMCPFKLCVRASACEPWECTGGGSGRCSEPATAGIIISDSD